MRIFCAALFAFLFFVAARADDSLPLPTRPQPAAPTPPASSPATAPISLEGTWQDTGSGDLMKVSDSKGSIGSTWSQRADQSVIKVGDGAISGSFDAAGMKLTGIINLRFPLKWGAGAHTGTLTMTLSADGQTLSGQFQASKIDKDGKVTLADMVPLTLQRMPEEIKDANIGPLDGDL